MTSNIRGILLAAGQSSRFGSNKLLHPLGNGKTIIEQSADNLFKACPDSIAVISKQSLKLTELLSNTDLTIIENTQAENGIGSSIACGVHAATDADGWLIALADMPFIDNRIMQKIMQGMGKTKCIIAPSHNQQRGHPVLFSKHFYEQLSQLNSDIGARDIIKNNLDKLKLIEIDDTAIFRDIDVFSDLT